MSWEWLGGFVFEYFCRPIIDRSVQGYNLVNTATYALILLLAVVFVIVPFLRRNKVHVDYRFVISLLPYIIFGSVLRVLNDMGGFEKTCNPLEFSFFTFTPGIWILTAALTMLAMIMARRVASGEDEFYKIFGITGVIILLPFLTYEISQFMALNGFVLISVMAIVITLGVKFIVSHFRKGFFKDGLNSLVLAGQVLDGCATFVATYVYTCGEQHPLSSYVLGVNPALFIAVKIAIAILLIHFIDSDIKDKNYAGLVKMAALILGLAPGTRDLLTVAVGTCL